METIIQFLKEIDDDIITISDLLIEDEHMDHMDHMDHMIHADHMDHMIHADHIDHVDKVDRVEDGRLSMPSTLMLLSAIRDALYNNKTDKLNCSSCGGSLIQNTSGIENFCANCGQIYVIEDDIDTSEIETARLRIVGPGSNQLQPDLYRSSSGLTNNAQITQIYNEFVKYMNNYTDQNGRAFPLTVCKLAAVYYTQIKQIHVRRNKKKSLTMIECFRQACLEHNIVPSKKELTKFINLPNRGLAKGENYVRKLVSDGKVNINLDMDPIQPTIESTLTKVFGEHYEKSRFISIIEATKCIIQIANNNYIGINSVLNSKIVSATFAILYRCADTLIVPKQINSKDFCIKCQIRKNTVEKFVKELNSYNSFFEDVYKKYGLRLGLIDVSDVSPK